ncbi:hypothetical protein [Duganella sp. BJB1802]|uniref:hypothetical protein n=1 Tax=Duganella sp. BJB1802 TaxID=2744575 RepID=UPI001E60FA53|nr:hypothetical protein [Duganella sp. BJB1802]
MRRKRKLDIALLVKWKNQDQGAGKLHRRSPSAARLAGQIQGAVIGLGTFAWRRPGVFRAGGAFALHQAGLMVKVGESGLHQSALGHSENICNKNDAIDAGLIVATSSNAACALESAAAGAAPVAGMDSAFKP